MNKKEWHVYILECCDDSIYTGVTNNIEKRMRVHASGKGSKYVARKGFRQLVASKPCHDKSHACKCEYEIKQLPRNHKKDAPPRLKSRGLQRRSFLETSETVSF